MLANIFLFFSPTPSLPTPTSPCSSSASSVYSSSAPPSASSSSSSLVLDDDDEQHRGDLLFPSPPPAELHTVKKVYVVTKMDHCDNFKRPGTHYEVVRVFKDQGQAYEFAHDHQVLAMQMDGFLAHKTAKETNKWKMIPNPPKYVRDEKMDGGSWKVSHEKLIKLLYEILPPPEFYMMASHVRFDVKEITVD
ncbi:hypothetical protein BGZ83_006116 [Gryganskiella cystojenkinii]|nr:hypothetical protein BGZ83_006116 [Gryganskiella cystojenkinii]